MIQLSKRLKTVTRFIPENSVLADIGSDHAYLPIYTISLGIVRKAIAGEVADGPYESALANVKRYQLQEKIDVRKGDGLTVLRPEDRVNCIVIAGMGGALIQKILEAGKDRLFHTDMLVLQPNVSAYLVRKWLLEHDWQLAQEVILEEDGHIYEVLVARRGNPYAPYRDEEKELFFGPFLLKEKSAVFKKKWTREREEWMQILKQLEKARQTEEIVAKRQELITYLQWYKEVFGDESSERT